MFSIPQQGVALFNPSNHRAFEESSGIRVHSRTVQINDSQIQFKLLLRFFIYLFALY